MGGYSHEWEISMKSGAVIAENLDSDLYHIYTVAILKEGWYYKDAAGKRHEINKNDFSLSIEGKKSLLTVVTIPYMELLERTASYKQC